MNVLAAIKCTVGVIRGVYKWHDYNNCDMTDRQYHSQP